VKEDEKTEKTFGGQLLEFLREKQIPRKTLCDVAQIDKGLLSKIVNGSRPIRAWKAFLMGWQLGAHYASRRMLTTPEGRLLCTA
jgi:hypothetical protein